MEIERQTNNKNLLSMNRQFLFILLHPHYPGVRLCEGVSVEGVEVENGRVCGVRTNKGDIKCDIFVNCAGMVSIAPHVFSEWLQ